MRTKETAEEFLRRHNMFYEQQPFEDLTDAYIADMRAGLRGEAAVVPSRGERAAHGRERSRARRRRHESARRTRPL